MFQDILKKLRLERGYSMEALADSYNKRFDGRLNKSTISRYENGLQEPMYPVVRNLADLFDVSADYLLGLTDIKKAPAGAYPVGEIVQLAVMASVKAGYDSSAVEDFTDEVETVPMTFLNGYSPNECRILRVKGNSMYPRICDGDLVLVHVQSSVDSGDTAVVLYNGDEATIKKVRYVPGEDWMELIPANPEYQVKRLEGSELEICRIFGRVIKLIREF